MCSRNTPRRRAFSVWSSFMFVKKKQVLAIIILTAPCVSALIGSHRCQGDGDFAYRLELFSLDTAHEGFSFQIQCLMDTRSPEVAFCSLMRSGCMLKLEKQSSLMEICLLRMFFGLL